MNAPGPFYVMNDSCIACEAPELEAPDLMSHEEIGPLGFYCCYFKNQPKTPEELDRAILAVIVSCCGAVRYKGRDPQVLNWLRKSAARQCDASPESIAVRSKLPRPLQPPANAPDRSNQGCE